MDISSALIGLCAGILLAMMTEIIKKAAQKKIVASKLLAHSINALTELLERNSLIVVHARRIYSDNNVVACEKRLTDHLDELKVKMKTEAKAQEWINDFKIDKVSADKDVYMSNLTEEKYKNDTLLLSRLEISILPPRIQSMVNYKIENQFQAAVAFRFLILQINSENQDIDKCIDGFAEVCKYIIKTHKDDEILTAYSKKVSNRWLLGNMLLD